MAFPVTPAHREATGVVARLGTDNWLAKSMAVQEPGSSASTLVHV
jgi:hypothetical protein